MARFPWLGNKLSVPRMPGAGKARRAGQVASTGYTTVGQIMRGAGVKLPKMPKSIKIKF